MPESTPENPSTAAPEQPAQPESATPPATPNPTDEPLGAPGLRALQTEREQRATAERERDELARRVAEFEQANLTELEREKAAREKAEGETVTERTQRLRLQAAIDYGIPKDYLDLLTAADEAALKAQAEKVAVLVKANANQPPAPLPGQGTPSAPVAATVASGAALYQQQKQQV